MRVQVHLSPCVGSEVEPSVVMLECGAGDQILRWVGCTACARLAIQRGDVVGRYVPQAVRDGDGRVLDADTILNARFSDGCRLDVDYSSGPVAFQTRWLGRPKTPPFKWGLHGEETPEHDSWLTEADFTSEPLVTRVLPSILQMDAETAGSYDAEADCQALHTSLLRAAGGIQSAFMVLNATPVKTHPQTPGRISSEQFRAFIQSTSADFPLDTCDDAFYVVATDIASALRRGEDDGAASLDLRGFFFALVQIASHWGAGESASGAVNRSSLSSQFDAFWTDCCTGGILRDVHTKIRGALESQSPEAQAVMRNARRGVERTLEVCQTKRKRSSELRVELSHLCEHLAKWELLGREFSLQDLAAMAVFALQEGSDFDAFILHPEPVSLNYDAFEKLLFEMIWHMCLAQKKRDHFAAFLSETLDEIFKKAGIMI